ncbi:hypothetical protein [Streptomyces avidinii]
MGRSKFLGIGDLRSSAASLVFDGFVEGAFDGVLDGLFDGWLSLPVVAGFVSMLGFTGAIVLWSTGPGPGAEPPPKRWPAERAGWHGGGRLRLDNCSGRLAPERPPRFHGTVVTAIPADGYGEVLRYAEPRTGTAGAALDFARTDGASADTATALVLSRVDGNVRYLTAPWVTGAALRDLLKPAVPAVVLKSAPDGVTPPVASPAPAGSCTGWNALALTGDGATRLITDLGELTPARLTSGAPGAERDVTEAAELGDWARIACLLPAVRSHGVRTVNAWTYAKQPLPEGDGTAAWLCTRAETWQGAADRVQAQFLAPGAPMAAQAARSEGSAACGPREPRVLAGVLWKSRAGQWYVLAAGSAQFASLSVSGGGVSGSANGNRLAVKAQAGAQVDLSGKLTDGTKAGVLR